jgi:hypothetical protein
MLSIFATDKERKCDLFFRNLRQYSCYCEEEVEEENREELVKEWFILFKEKCQQNKQCICGHYIRNYAHVYNVLNGNIVIIGLGCCKKYGITEVTTNLVLLEFLTETDAGSLLLQNGHFDINTNMDFIMFIHTELMTMNNRQKENLEFYVRKLEILRKNIGELIDHYYFYCGVNILRNIDDILSELTLGLNDNPPQNIDDILRDFIYEDDIETVVVTKEDVAEKMAIKCTMDKLLIQIENPEQTYTFRDPSLNELCRHADRVLLNMKLDHCEYEYIDFQMSHYSLYKKRGKK